ncbi:hypothetical protein LP419_34630 [Massilia sp. H-1]|nr:hypothetical protein LP419_34630 [Massilia sp. H-1]
MSMPTLQLAATAPLIVTTSLSIRVYARRRRLAMARSFCAASFSHCCLISATVWLLLPTYEWLITLAVLAFFLPSHLADSD